MTKISDKEKKFGFKLIYVNSSSLIIQSTAKYCGTGWDGDKITYRIIR